MCFAHIWVQFKNVDNSTTTFKIGFETIVWAVFKFLIVTRKWNGKLFIVANLNYEM